MEKNQLKQWKDAIETNDLPAVQAVLLRNPEALPKLGVDDGNSILGLLGWVQSPAMVDLLLNHGWDLDRLSNAWAPGLNLGRVPVPVAERLWARGAKVSVHAAAALGLLVPLGDLLSAFPDRVGEAGGDGCHPLHFARNVTVAELLLSRGALVDARDDDHASTPAQWRIGEAPEVTRYLLQRGATPDLFMAAGLGDLDLVQRLVAQNPAITAYRIGNNLGPFPGIGFQGRGGTIYQWTLGFNRSAQEIAFQLGYREIFEYLMPRTPPGARLLIACAMADQVLAENILASTPSLLTELTTEDKSLLAKLCWETNLNPVAVRLMLDLGFPVAIPEFNHGFQPLHNAAWCGHAGLVQLLIERGHPVQDRDPNHHGTPLDWAIHSCLREGRHPDGEFAQVLQLLLRAGATLPKGIYPTGRADLDLVLRSFLGA